MRRILDWIIRVWSKVEYSFSVGVGVALLALSSLFFALVVNDKMSFPWLLGFGFVLILSCFWAFRASLAIYSARTYRSLSSNYREAYSQSQENYEQLQENFEKAVNVCNEWEKYSNEWKRHANELQKKYFNDVDTVFAQITKHSEILPQQQALLSNLVKSGVHASAIKSLLEFSNKVDNNTTVFLIRMHHENASWFVEIAGRTIELDQATYVVKSVEKKLKDFAGKNSLVKNTPKICN